MTEIPEIIQTYVDNVKSHGKLIDDLIRKYEEQLASRTKYFIEVLNDDDRKKYTKSRKRNEDGMAKLKEAGYGICDECGTVVKTKNKWFQYCRDCGDE